MAIGWNFRRHAFAASLILILLSQLLVAQGVSDEVLPSGQKSDGCTLIPDTDIKPCCLVHDREYYFGGTRGERRESDKKFYDCVKKKKGFHHKIFAPFIWLGVRIGGLPFLPTSFRWGFGSKEKGYAKTRVADKSVETNP
jgi:hypothetical protein